MGKSLYNQATSIRMIAPRERRKPWLAAWLAILLAAPGVPMAGAPQKDPAQVGLNTNKSRIGVKDPVQVDVRAKGRSGQPLKGWLVTLFLPEFGAGLVGASGEKTLQGEIGSDGHARFPGLRSNNIFGAFNIKIIVREPGPDGETIEKQKTLRNVKGIVLFGLSVKQLVGIAAGGAVVAGVLGCCVLGGSSTQPTVITPGPPAVTTGRKPRR